MNEKCKELKHDHGVAAQERHWRAGTRRNSAFKITLKTVPSGHGNSQREASGQSRAAFQPRNARNTLPPEIEIGGFSAEDARRAMGNSRPSLMNLLAHRGCRSDVSRAVSRIAKPTDRRLARLKLEQSGPLEGLNYGKMALGMGSEWVAAWISAQPGSRHHVPANSHRMSHGLYPKTPPALRGRVRNSTSEDNACMGSG